MSTRRSSTSGIFSPTRSFGRFAFRRCSGVRGMCCFTNGAKRDSFKRVFLPFFVVVFFPFFFFLFAVLETVQGKPEQNKKASWRSSHSHTHTERHTKQRNDDSDR